MNRAMPQLLPSDPVSSDLASTPVAAGLENLTSAQLELLSLWLPTMELAADHSWGLVDTTVLEVVSGADRFIVKAAGDSDHHLEREIRAHRRWLEPWTSAGRAPDLVHADLDAKIIVTRYQPGRLVLGSEAAEQPDTYRQAGELLAQLHRQPGASVVDDNYEQRVNARSLAWLDQSHRIAPLVEERLRALVTSWPTGPATLVPTHGDWQPRNWLIEDGLVSVIDFGRADLRPASTDLARLAAQEFRRAPDLEAAFFEGYGSDPRDPESWHRMQVREAIGTAAWAFQVGDEGFEAQGHRMIAEALGDFSAPRDLASGAG